MLRPNDTPLSSKVAVITGAGGGMGAAIARKLATEGANLVLLELKLQHLEDLSAEITEGGTRVITLQCDVTSDASIRQAAQDAMETMGRFDVLINSAGILPGHSTLESVSVEEWDRVFAVNTRGAFLCARHFGADMLVRGHGSIINIASIAGYNPNACAPYGPSKAAAAALTRQIAVEWGPLGIRCNSISPGFIRTPMSAEFYANPDVLELRRNMVASRKIGESEDVASLVSFLAGDHSGFINGQDIVIDGGFLHTALMRSQAA